MATDRFDKTLKSQEKYYRELHRAHRGTPQAVSSESLVHKELRYAFLSKVFGCDPEFTVHDLGMGVGHYYEYLQKTFHERQIEYSGTEILKEYLEEFHQKYPDNRAFHRDILKDLVEDTYDYVIVSGVFHQRRETSIRDWESFIQVFLEKAYAMARKGIAFNFVSPFVDFIQPDIHYCNLHKLLEFINERLSRFFVVHHSYPLFELTVQVYRPEYVQSCFVQPEFQKYFKT